MPSRSQDGRRSTAPISNDAEAEGTAAARCSRRRESQEQLSEPSAGSQFFHILLSFWMRCTSCITASALSGCTKAGAKNLSPLLKLRLTQEVCWKTADADKKRCRQRGCSSRRTASRNSPFSSGGAASPLPPSLMGRKKRAAGEEEVPERRCAAAAADAAQAASPPVPALEQAADNSSSRSKSPQQPARRTTAVFVSS